MYLFLIILFYSTLTNAFVINKLNINKYNYFKNSNKLKLNMNNNIKFDLNITNLNNNTNSFISNYNIMLNTKDITNKLIYNNNIPKILRYSFKKFSLNDSELKHSRIAMLAVIGRFSAETIHPYLADKLYSKNLLVNNELVPSLLNGGLNKIHPIFYIFTLMYIFLIELNNLIEISDISYVKKKNNNISSFDPLNIYNDKTEIQKMFIQKNEIYFGRISMILSTWFSYYEYVSKKNIINDELLIIYPWLILGIIIVLYT